MKIIKLLTQELGSCLANPVGLEVDGRKELSSGENEGSENDEWEDEEDFDREQL